MNAQWDGVEEGAAVCVKPSLTGNGPEVLLIRSTKAGKPWMFPKGHVEHGESAVECAIRELEEETGFIAYPLYEIGDAKLCIAQVDYKIKHFRCQIAGRVEPKDIKRTYFWCPIAHAPYILQYQSLRDIIFTMIAKEDIQ